MFQYIGSILKVCTLPRCREVKNKLEFILPRNNTFSLCIAKSMFCLNSISELHILSKRQTKSNLQIMIQNIYFLCTKKTVVKIEVFRHPLNIFYQMGGQICKMEAERSSGWLSDDSLAITYNAHSSTYPYIPLPSIPLLLLLSPCP